jgi:hypothetical protein
VLKSSCEDALKRAREEQEELRAKLSGTEDDLKKARTDAEGLKGLRDTSDEALKKALDEVARVQKDLLEAQEGLVARDAAMAQMRTVHDDVLGSTAASKDEALKEKQALEVGRVKGENYVHTW